MAARWMGLIAIVCTALIILAGMQTSPAERIAAGNSLHEQGEFETALRAYQMAQVYAPDAPEAYYNAASALSGIGRLRDASAALEQALKAADNLLAFRIYYNLGNVLFQMARYGEAVQAYQQAIRLNPADDEARYNYELALLQRVPTPTPTPQEQQTDPEENEADSTPTNSPVNQEGPTATPTPPLDSPPEEDATPQGGFTGEVDDGRLSSPTPATGGPLTVEDVERQLDAIQANQQTLREFLQQAATPSRPNAKDW